MDTDKHRLGKSGAEETGRGKEKGKEQEKDAAQDAFYCILSQSEAVFISTRKNMITDCAARRSKMGLGDKYFG